MRQRMFSSNALARQLESWKNEPGTLDFLITIWEGLEQRLGRLPETVDRDKAEDNIIKVQYGILEMIRSLRPQTPEDTIRYLRFCPRLLEAVEVHDKVQRGRE